MSCAGRKSRFSVFGFRASGFGLPFRTLLSGLLLTLALRPGSLLACAACYGQSDSPMANGMNWGIMSLLVVIGGVLGGVAAFFIYLARRAASATADPAKPNPGRASVPASPDFGTFPEKLELAGTLAFPISTNPMQESTDPIL